MPTISSSNTPTPKSWDEFENITLSAAKLRWYSSDFFRNGRPGQKQDGVDIWGHDDDGRHIGIQCKNTVAGVSLETVKSEIKNAKAFVPKLDRLYIATTAERDGPLQKVVRKLSDNIAKSGGFKVDLLFWDDICNDLARDEDVYFQHYPQFKQGGVNQAVEHDRKLMDELTKLLRFEGIIQFLDNTNMAGFSFRRSILDPLWEFEEKWKSPEREFIAPELEKLRQDLRSTVREYCTTIAYETFVSDSNADFQTVPPEWEDEDPERFKRVVNKLHSLAGKIVSLHAELVRAGRIHLLT